MRPASSQPGRARTKQKSRHRAADKTGEREAATYARPLTRADLEAYRARWRRTNEFQIEEMRRMPLASKLRRANMLFRLALSLKLRHTVDDPEIAAVRERWVKLKRMHENAKGT
jgi:hypothetical protein